MPPACFDETTQRGGRSQSSSCSSTRRLMPSPATTQPSMVCGAGRFFQTVSARASIVSRKTAPCASKVAPGAAPEYCAHFKTGIAYVDGEKGHPVWLLLRVALRGRRLTDSGSTTTGCQAHYIATAAAAIRWSNVSRSRRGQEIERQRNPVGSRQGRRSSAAGRARRHGRLAPFRCIGIVAQGQAI